MNSKIIGILRQAREILKRDGWVQGELHMDGMHCALGAIEAAAEEASLSLSNWGIVDEAKRTLAEAISGGYGEISDIADAENTVASYNDAPKRTIDDILRAFNNAIRKAKETTA